MAGTRHGLHFPSLSFPSCLPVPRSTLIHFGLGDIHLHPRGSGSPLWSRAGSILQKTGETWGNIGLKERP